MDIVDLVNKYGFPIIAAGGVGYMIYFVWKWVTEEIKPVIGAANGTLIALIDRIRMLDNDLIRLNQKVETVMQLRGKSIELERIEADKAINKTAEEHKEAVKAPPTVTKKEIQEAAGDD